MLGKTDYDVFPEEFADSYFKLEKDVFAGVPVAHEIQRTLTKVGKPGWVDNRKYPVKDDKGTVVGVFGIARDITAQRLAEQALDSSEERHRSLFFNLPQGVVYRDGTGRFVAANPAALAILGTTHQELVGRSTLPSHWHVQYEDGSHASDADLPGHEALRTARPVGPRILGLQHANLPDQRWISITSIPISGAGDTKPTEVFAILEDVTERRNLQMRLEKLGHYDTLTGLPNRLLLFDRLQLAMLQCARRGTPIVVVYLDLDGFKGINDRFGHDAGDYLLATLADRMLSVLRDTDTLARIGGDEFVIVLSDLHSPQESHPVLQRLLEAAAQPMQFMDNTLQVTASLGATVYPQTSTVSAEQLIRQADEAMYVAKTSGRNRLRFYGE